ncbi:MAG: hypothetical protein IM591_10335, partial [Chitinophagaceae bacterium]|nr:hypothetical protein [Chitinophagaceae bacterium]
VNPAAIISTINTTVCSGVTFRVTPTSPSNGVVPEGTTYQWQSPVYENPSLTGGAAGAPGQIDIFGTIDNPTNTRYYARYSVVPTTGICVGATFIVNAFINPIPAVTSTLTATICSGQTFSVSPTNGIDGSVPVATNMFYTWGAPQRSSTSLTGGVSGNSGVGGSINGTLTNGTNSLQTAVYSVTPVYTNSGVNCAGSNFTVVVFVNSRAVINTMTEVTCSGTPFNITPTNGIHGIVPLGTTYTWFEPTYTGGLSGGAAMPISQTSIFGTISSTSSSIQTATYTVVPTTVDCGPNNPFTLLVTVYPRPLIDAMTTVTCSGIPFAVSPADVTNGRVPVNNTYSWTVPTYTTTSLSGGESRNGQSNIFGLINSTSNQVETATYTVTPTSQYNCVGTPFTLTVTVNPGGFITAMTTSTCSGVMFNVTPVNGTNGVVPDNTQYTWEAPNYTGTVTGGVSSNGRKDGIFGTLTNQTNITQTVTYIVTAYPPTGSCANNTFTVTVTLFPAPQINEMSTVICSGLGFTVAATNVVNGIVPVNTQYIWNTPNRSTVSLTNGTSNSTYTSTISGLLNNGTNLQQTATYLVTPRALLNSCLGSPFTLTVFVNPTPSLITFNRVICTAGTFEVSPTTNYTNGIVPVNTNYTWSAPVNANLSGLLSASNAASISGTLSHITNAPISVAYNVVPRGPVDLGSCVGATFVVNVIVNPRPVINTLSTTVCSGLLFTVTPVTGSVVPAPATMNYDWTYLQASSTSLTGGINGTSGFGGLVTGTLTNGTNIQQTATYNVIPTYTNAGLNCVGAAFSAVVYVNPKAVINQISTTVCSGYPFEVSPANLTNGIVPAGTVYTWSAPQVISTLLVTGGTGASLAQSISGTLRNTTNVMQTAVYTVIPTSENCGPNDPFTLTVFVNPTPEITAMSTTVCSGFTFRVTPTNGANGIVPQNISYTWNSLPQVSSTSLTGGVTASNQPDVNGRLTNNTSSPQTATYLVTPTGTTGTCVGANFTVTVLVIPGGYVDAMSTTVCSGYPFNITPTDGVNGIIPDGTKFRWELPSYSGSLSGGASNTDQLSIFGLLSNSSNVTQTAVYIVTPQIENCAAYASFTLTVFVNPTPVISELSTVICSGLPFEVSPVNNGSVIVPVTTRYSWDVPAVSNASLTGGASASNQLSINGILTNNSNVTRTAVYIVTPTTTLGDCVGTTFTVLVTVNPKAVITAMSATICSGTTFNVTPTDITNGIVPANTRYSWDPPTVSNPSLTGGQSASLVDGIYGFLHNGTNVMRTAVYIVTPRSELCLDNNPFTVTVFVNPKPEVTPMSTVVCSGLTFQVSPANGRDGIVPVNSNYSWTLPSLSTPSLTGRAAESGAFVFGTLTNNTNVQQSATYTVTPTAPAPGSCVGSTFTVIVYVDPKAVITPMSTTICSGTSFNVTPTNGQNGIVPDGTTYTWSAPDRSSISLTGGLGASLVNSISGTLHNGTNRLQTAVYTVTPRTLACGDNNPFTVTVFVNPTPEITAMTTVVCSGFTFEVSPSNFINGIVPQAISYSWNEPILSASLTGGQSGTNQPYIFGTLNSTASVAQTATYSVIPTGTNGTCEGLPFTLTVTVNPGGYIDEMSTTVCSGYPFNITPTNGVNGIIPNGTTFNWDPPTQSTSITGGTGAILQQSISGKLFNGSNVTRTAVYIVTPNIPNCGTTFSTFTLTVYVDPTPVISELSRVTCSGVAFDVSPVNGGSVIVPANTRYAWEIPAVSNPSLTGGASASNQSSVTGRLTNNTNTTQTALYIVTPTTVLGSCQGATFTVLITVDPKAVINNMTAVICSGETFNVTPTNSTNGIVPEGTLFSWNPPSFTSSISGGQSNSDQASVFGTLNNTGNLTQTATYIVTPTTLGCGPNNQFSVVVTIHAKPEITTIAFSECSHVPFNVVPSNGTNGIVPPNTRYTWDPPQLSSLSITGGQSGVNAASIAGRLQNNTPIVQTVTYTVSPVSSSTGCAGANFTIIITLNPCGLINNLTTVTCSGVAFEVSPRDGIDGVVPSDTRYDWGIPEVSSPSLTGGQAGAAGQLSIYGNLHNATNVVQTAVYTVFNRTELGSCDGLTFTVTVFVNPTPEISTMSTVICTGVEFELSPANGLNGIVPANTSYSWDAPTYTASLSGGQTGTLENRIFGTLMSSSNVPQTATYIVTPRSAALCTGATFTVKVTVNPGAFINSISRVTCSGVLFEATPVQGTNGIVPEGTLYSWSEPVFTGTVTGGEAQTDKTRIYGLLSNRTNTTQTVTYTVFPSSPPGICAGLSFQVIVTLNPTPEVGAMTTVTCSGVQFVVTPTNDTNGIVPDGSLFSWSVPTFTGTVLGGASATNNLRTVFGTLSNRTNTTQTVTYNVVPSTVKGCTGANFTVTVTLNPTPEVGAMTTVTCSGVQFVVTPTNDTNGIVPDVSLYSWSVPTFTGTVLGAASATNNLRTVFGSLSNRTNTTQTVTYIVTPSTAEGCTGKVFTVTVTLNPTPEVSAMSRVVCNGVQFTVSPVNDTNGIVPESTLYTWNAPLFTASITGGDSGSDQPFIRGTLTNESNIAQQAYYNVFPRLGNCYGAPFSLTIYLNPTPVITQMTMVTCSGVFFNITPVDVTNGIVPVGTKYRWSAPHVTATMTGGESKSDQDGIYGNLLNRTNTVQTATYTVIPSISNCGDGAAFTVVVTVNPTAEIGTLSTVVCSGYPFQVSPAATFGGRDIVTADTKYRWDVPGYSGTMTGGQSRLDAAG